MTINGSCLKMTIYHNMGIALIVANCLSSHLPTISMAITTNGSRRKPLVLIVHVQLLSRKPIIASRDSSPTCDAPMIHWGGRLLGPCGGSPSPWHSLSCWHWSRQTSSVMGLPRLESTSELQQSHQGPKVSSRSRRHSHSQRPLPQLLQVSLHLFLAGADEFQWITNHQVINDHPVN